MKKVIYGILAFSPVLALAQNATQSINNLSGLLGNIRGLLNTLIPVLIALAVVYFFWGLVKFLGASGDPKAAEAARSQMIWGVIAIAVMVSIFGLVSFLQNTLGIQNTTIVPPQV
ncbi:MAG: hypothetical protein ABL917_01270 [Parcubacteria group bacterium]